MSHGNTVGSLTQIQHEVLVGTLLGDGTLRRQAGKLNAYLEVNHSYAVKEYVDWKYRIFQQYVLTPPKRRRGNGQRVAYRFTTRSLPQFTQYYFWFYGGKKRIPEDLQLTPRVLAVWFMDDGSKSRSSCYFNTQQFPLEDQQRLQWLLRSTSSIESSLNKDKIYWRIRITTESTKILHALIRPYILPYYRYKLGDDPVTTDPKGEAPQMMRGNTPTLTHLNMTMA